MSSPTLLDRLMNAGAGALDKHGEDWLSKGLDKAADLVADARENAPKGDSLEAKGAAAGLDLASDALNILGAEPGVVLAFTKGAAAGAMVQFASGQEGEARRRLLASGTLSLAETLGASLASTEATRSATLAREKAVDDFIALMKKIGQRALMAAIPFILAAL